MRPRRYHFGFTLIDLVVYISIMLMFLVLTSNFAVNMIRGQRRASEVQRSLEEVRRTFALLNYDLRYAQSIDTVNSVFNDVNGIVVFQARDGSQIRYERSGTTLTRKVGVGSADAVTTSLVAVEGFTIQYAGQVSKNLQSVRVGLAVRAGIDAGGQVTRATYTSTITRR